MYYFLSVNVVVTDLLAGVVSDAGLCRVALCRLSAGTGRPVHPASGAAGRGHCHLDL